MLNALNFRKQKAVRISKSGLTSAPWYERVTVYQMITRHLDKRITQLIITLRRFFALPSLHFFAQRLRFTGVFSFSTVRLRFLGITAREDRAAARTKNGMDLIKLRKIKMYDDYDDFGSRISIYTRFEWFSVY